MDAEPIFFAIIIIMMIFDMGVLVQITNSLLSLTDKIDEIIKMMKK